MGKKSNIGVLVLAATFLVFGTIYAQDETITEFNKAIELNPHDAQAYYGRGMVYGTKGNYDQAISDFSKVIELNPNDARAYYRRGTLYGMKGSFSDQAISDFNKAIELNPNDATAYYGRGVAHYQGEEYDKAWADMHKAEGLGYKINPDFLEHLKKASGREK